MEELFPQSRILQLLGIYMPNLLCCPLHLLKVFSFFELYMRQLCNL
ncbi:MAG: hypothetical protein IJB79_03850 [Candidatus Gastranaerophilales bacterium]|nr:hypothetical protein [Candidatus Gastranaerophilales bacterium]